MCADGQFQDLFAVVPISNQGGETSTDAEPVIAQVPFDFVVGEMLFPAGAYEVAQTGIPGTVALRPNGGEYPAALVREIRLEKDTSKLLFYQQENLYFLAQVLAGTS